MRTKGKIVSWNDAKGFGFIAPNSGGRQVFVHIKAFSNRGRRPETDQLVTYVLSTDKRGRPCASNATLAGDRLPHQTKWNPHSLSTFVAPVFLVLIGTAAFASLIPPWVLALYLAASLCTFILYAVDKSAAQKGNWRTPENTLHLFALAGGWPGALLAQQTLRHKSRKQPFRILFWMTVIVNCGVLTWGFTPGGSDALQTLTSSVLLG